MKDFIISFWKVNCMNYTKLAFIDVYQDFEINDIEFMKMHMQILINI